MLILSAYCSKYQLELDPKQELVEVVAFAHKASNALKSHQVKQSRYMPMILVPETCTILRVPAEFAMYAAQWQWKVLLTCCLRSLMRHLPSMIHRLESLLLSAPALGTTCLFMCELFCSGRADSANRAACQL